jgi:hypothetical protein
MDIDPEKIARSPFVIGALGALVALRGAPGETWPTRLINVVCGALFAGFLSPGIAEWFSLTSPAMQGAMAFASGLFGMNFVATAVAWIKELKLADVLPWARRKE